MHVILPIQPPGTAFDLIMWAHSLYSPNRCPIHYLSKSGRKQIAQLDILSEWLRFVLKDANKSRMQPDRQTRVHSGRPPTLMSEWIAQEQLFVHDHIFTLFARHQSVSRVVFCDLDQVAHLAQAMAGPIIVIWTGTLTLQVHLPRSTNGALFRGS